MQQVKKFDECFTATPVMVRPKEGGGGGGGGLIVIAPAGHVHMYTYVPMPEFFLFC